MTITDILDHYNVDYKTGGQHHHVSHGWAGVDCPRCSPQSNSFKMGISLQYGGCSCWTCGQVSLVELLRELTSEPWSTCKDLASKFRSRIVGVPSKARGTLKTPAGLGRLLEAHKRYLRSRGFDPDQLERLWGLKGIALAVRLSWSIWLPVMYRNEVVSWVTRSLSNKGTRYVVAKPDEEKLPAKSLLVGNDYIRHATIVTEGYFDMMKIGPGACCTLGTTYTHSQVQMLSHIPLRVVCYDTDLVAQERARKLCDELSCYPGKTMRVEIDAKDPGSATQKEIALLRRSFLD